MTLVRLSQGVRHTALDSRLIVSDDSLLRLKGRQGEWEKGKLGFCLAMFVLAIKTSIT